MSLEISTEQIARFLGTEAIEQRLTDVIGRVVANMRLLLNGRIAPEQMDSHIEEIRREIKANMAGLVSRILTGQENNSRSREGAGIRLLIDPSCYSNVAHAAPAQFGVDETSFPPALLADAPTGSFLSSTGEEMHIIWEHPSHYGTRSADAVFAIAGKDGSIWVNPRKVVSR